MNTEFMEPQSITREPADGAGGSVRLRREPPLSLAGFPSQVRFILQLLQKLEYGSLRMEFPNGQVAHYGDDSHPVTLALANWDICNAALKSGPVHIFVRRWVILNIAIDAITAKASLTEIDLP